MTKVAVIKPDLKYRLENTNKGRSFVPKVGAILDLPLEVARTELKSGNVRKLLPEEKKEQGIKVTASSKNKNKKNKNNNNSSSNNSSNNNNNNNKKKKKKKKKSEA